MKTIIRKVPKERAYSWSVIDADGKLLGGGYAYPRSAAESDAAIFIREQREAVRRRNPPAADQLFSPLQDKLNRELLKYAAGHHIFCPACQQIMDCRRTVITDVVAVTPDGREVPVKSLVRCAKCFDKYLPIVQGYVQNFKPSPTTAAIKLEIVDGRKFKWR